jgi:hypothetical protein
MAGYSSEEEITYMSSPARADLDDDHDNETAASSELDARICRPNTSVIAENDQETVLDDKGAEEVDREPDGGELVNRVLLKSLTHHLSQSQPSLAVT